jgi:hypothetical protein
MLKEGTDHSVPTCKFLMLRWRRPWTERSVPFFSICSPYRRKTSRRPFSMRARSSSWSGASARLMRRFYTAIRFERRAVLGWRRPRLFPRCNG